MAVSFRRSVYFASTALTLSLVTYAAQAYPALPNLENLNFLGYTGTAPKGEFTSVKPVGWTGGTGLIYIDSPGTSHTSATTACGTTYLQTYGCPGNLSIPGGYNEVEADGNPNFGSGFKYEVTGLTIGQIYTLSFYQAASQQNAPTYTAATTNQWIVALGGAGLTVTSLGACDPTCSTYADPGGDIVATPLMHVPGEGLVDWNYVSIDLTATATSELLSFLAWGDSGSTANEPPIAFLAGVNSAAGLAPAPEPASLSLFGVGLLGLGAIARRRRGKSSTAA